MIQAIKNFIRHKLGFRDIYHIKGELPLVTKELLENPHELAQIKLTGLSIDSGCVIQIEGKKYMVINSILEVMSYDK